MPKKKIRTFNLEPDWDERFELVCKRRGITQNALLNHLLEEVIPILETNAPPEVAPELLSASSSECLTYCTILRRCYDPEHRDYIYYGARGITVCERWRDGIDGRANFLHDMGKRPPGLSLDRKDNNGPYSPENCRWATSSEQINNRGEFRSTVKRQLHIREIKRANPAATAEEVAKQVGISSSAVYEHYRKMGWSTKGTPK